MSVPMKKRWLTRVKRAGADTIEGETRSADVVAGVGRQPTGPTHHAKRVPLPSNLECTLVGEKTN